jgi:hypothetical protein
MTDETRKDRGINQKFYLITLTKTEELWTIVLEGLTNRYTVNLSTDSINCNCPDYEHRGQICKHLYFIILKIAGCYQILLDHDMIDQKKIKSKDFEQLDQNLKNKIQEHNKKGDDENPGKRQKIVYECLICLEEIKQDQNELECVSQCHKHYHKSCLQKWLAVNKNCPHCRAINSFQIQEFDMGYNPWNRLEKINVK